MFSQYPVPAGGLQDFLIQHRTDDGSFGHAPETVNPLVPQSLDFLQVPLPQEWEQESPMAANTLMGEARRKRVETRVNFIVAVVEARGGVDGRPTLLVGWLCLLVRRTRTSWRTEGVI